MSFSPFFGYALGNPLIPDPFEIVLVVGRPIAEWPGSKTEDTEALKVYHARVIEYDKLIRGAQAAYRQYFEKKSKAHKVLNLIKKLEAEGLKKSLYPSRPQTIIADADVSLMIISDKIAGEVNINT